MRLGFGCVVWDFVFFFVREGGVGDVLGCRGEGGVCEGGGVGGLGD